MHDSPIRPQPGYAGDLMVDQAPVSSLTRQRQVPTTSHAAPNRSRQRCPTVLLKDGLAAQLHLPKATPVPAPADTLQRPLPGRRPALLITLKNLCQRQPCSPSSSHRQNDSTIRRGCTRQHQAVLAKTALLQKKARLFSRPRPVVIISG